MYTQMVQKSKCAFTNMKTNIPVHTNIGIQKFGITPNNQSYIIIRFVQRIIRADFMIQTSKFVIYLGSYDK
jgi:hypothetical protein